MHVQYYRAETHVERRMGLISGGAICQFELILIPTSAFEKMKSRLIGTETGIMPLELILLIC